MLAQVIAVIAMKDNDRVVPQLKSVERLQQDADLGIHEADRGVISRDGVARFAPREFCIAEAIG